MSDTISKAKEVKDLMDDLFESKPKNLKGLKEVHLVPKPTIRDKKTEQKIVHENKPAPGGTVVHGASAQVIHNHKVIDYKIDNTAIDQGRAAIGTRKRGDRVDTIYMSPKEFENFLHHKYKIAGKRGWNGIERSDFAQNWESDESQIVNSKKEALEYLGIKETKKSPDGVEKRNSDRRSGNKDIRKKKAERRISAKGRRKEDLTNNLTYFITMGVLLVSLISWISYSVVLYIEGLVK